MRPTLGTVVLSSTPAWPIAGLLVKFQAKIKMNVMILDLGVLLYILLSGHRPFQDGSPSKILTGKYEEMQGGCWDGDNQGSRAEPVSEGAKVGRSVISLKLYYCRFRNW